MSDRTSSKTVTFRYPATIAGLDTAIAPGSYLVEVEEELIPGLSFTAYRRVRTTIVLPIRTSGLRGRQVVEIDPQSLAEALVRDEAAD